MKKLVKISLVTLFGLFLISNLNAQISIDYTPIEGLCSNDAESCTAPVAYLFSLSAEDVSGISVSHQIKIEGGEPEEDTFGTLSGTYPGYLISGDYPIGNYTLVVTVNQGEQTFFAEMPLGIVDCIAPELECMSMYTVPYQPMPDGCCASAAWASNVVNTFSENCSGSVTFSIHRVSEVQSGADVPSSEQTGIVLDCNDSEPIPAYVYAWDNAFNPYAVQPDGTVGGPNYSVCVVTLLYYHDCPPNDEYSVGGVIKTAYDYVIEGVEVKLESSVEMFVLSSANGEYLFPNVPGWQEITLTPSHDYNPLNQISTLDIVLIFKHILGVQPLDSPYKIIAADINQSGHVSVADIIHLRKVILGIYADFPDNSAWRFIAADYVFPDPTNPWLEVFPEQRIIPELEQNELNENFIGIQIGDVSY